MRIILGIDPGTVVTGYGVVRQEGGWEALDYGCIRPPAGELPIRYKVIFESVTELMQRYQPKACAIETQFIAMDKSVTSVLKLGMARGVIMLAATLQNIPVIEYTPSEIKKSVAGQGRASKEQVQWMVQQLLRLSALPTPHDAADALAVALCHGQREKYVRLH